MQPLRQILGAASGSDKIIALSEGDDPRVVQAALLARTENAAKILLVGTGTIILKHLSDNGVSPAEIADEIEIHDPASSPLANEFRAALVSLR
ncbi:phosphate acyltransferase, partial [Roseobacter sp.]|uniref:phosphate acyltransferase n=1 Tax=Roseobacter sp. TaxID=1907202 RepID=UPI0032993D6F